MTVEPMDMNTFLVALTVHETSSVGYTEKAAIDAGYEVKAGKFLLLQKLVPLDIKMDLSKLADAKYGEWLVAT